jgi:hypothetical protein
MDYLKFALDERANSYILMKLNAGHLLAREVAQVIDINKGRAITMLPSMLSVDVVHDFKHGGKLAQPSRSTGVKIPGGIALPIPTMDFWLEEEIARYLNEASGNLCVFEDYVNRPGRLSGRTRQSRPIAIGEEIYYVLIDEDGNDKNIISETIEDASSAIPSLTCVFTRAPNFYLEVGNISAQFSGADLKRLALETRGVAIKAYDHEGFIFWWK